MKYIVKYEENIKHLETCKEILRLSRNNIFKSESTFNIPIHRYNVVSEFSVMQIQLDMLANI